MVKVAFWLDVLVPRRVYRSYRYIHHIQWWDINIDSALFCTWKSHYSTYQVEQGPNPLFFPGLYPPWKKTACSWKLLVGKEGSSLRDGVPGQKWFFQESLWEYFRHNSRQHTGGSENSGTPKSSILMGFSIINHPFWGTSFFGNTHTPLKHPCHILQLSLP